MQEISDGARSAAEAVGREIVLRSGLPTPLWNPRLYDQWGRFIAVPDAWFDDVGMAWQIDSREWHLAPADHEQTLDRRSAMMAEGVVVVHSLPSKLRRRAEMVEELRRSYAHAARRPRPDVLAIPDS
jgi:hypothetical protein